MATGGNPNPSVYLPPMDVDVEYGHWIYIIRAVDEDRLLKTSPAFAKHDNHRESPALAGRIIACIRPCGGATARRRYPQNPHASWPIIFKMEPYRD